MIPGLNIISGKINIASVNRAGGSGGGGTLSTSAGVLEGRAPYKNF